MFTKESLAAWRVFQTEVVVSGSHQTTAFTATRRKVFIATVTQPMVVKHLIVQHLLLGHGHLLTKAVEDPFLDRDAAAATAAATADSGGELFALARRARRVECTRALQIGLVVVSDHGGRQRSTVDLVHLTHVLTVHA